MQGRQTRIVSSFSIQTIIEEAREHLRRKLIYLKFTSLIFLKAYHYYRPPQKGTKKRYKVYSDINIFSMI